MAKTRPELEAELAMLGIAEDHLAAKKARRANLNDSAARDAYQAATDVLQAARAAQRVGRVPGGSSDTGGVTITPTTISVTADSPTPGR